MKKKQVVNYRQRCSALNAKGIYENQDSNLKPSRTDSGCANQLSYGHKKTTP